MTTVTIEQAIQMALAHQQAGRLAQAEAIYQQILKAQPSHPEALHFLGLLAKQVGKYEIAVELIGRALAVKPDYVKALIDLGNVHAQQGKLNEAIVSYRKVLELQPDCAAVHSNLGNVLQEQGLLDAALESYRKAIAFKPDFALALNNMGNVLKLQGKLDGAVEKYRQVLVVKPDFAEAHNNLGSALKEQGKHQEAIESFRKGIELRPDFADVHGNLIFTLDMTAGVDTGTMQIERKRWGKAHAAPLFQSRKYLNLPDPERRLRIGYVSADFWGHSAAYVFGAMLVNFDRSRFDVYAYSNTIKEDSNTLLFQQNVTCWRKIVGLSDEAAAELIRQDAIDILVDLSGHSAGNRLLVFARKPAPIQVTAWGYIGGTGMEAMDVFFADPVVVPAEDKPLYTEQVRYLPNVVSAFFPNAFPPVNALPAWTGSGVTFGSFNRLAKITDETYRMWAQVLLAIPDSRMILKSAELDDSGTRERVLGKFTQAGIASGRIVLLGGTPRDKHLEAFNLVDISLDPFPHGGGVTALEGLMMGAPVITLRCPTLVGRLSASVLTTLELTDWIAETPEQYVEIARRKAQDVAALADLRQQLRTRVNSSIIGDTEAYARAVEQEYRQLWREWCARNTSGT